MLAMRRRRVGSDGRGIHQRYHVYWMRDIWYYDIEYMKIYNITLSIDIEQEILNITKLNKYIKIYNIILTIDIQIFKERYWILYNNLEYWYWMGDIGYYDIKYTQKYNIILSIDIEGEILDIMILNIQKYIT